MFKFQEKRKQYYREEHIISENFDDKGSGLDSWVSKGMPFPTYGETILLMYQKKIEDLFGFRLVPTYSYARIYKHGDILKKHKDRPSCEISTTLNLGGDPWSIFIEGTEIKLSVGDMLVYSGCDLEHWRERFEGNICAQVFLHYNHLNGKFSDKNKFDGRPILGLPKWNFD